jgi:hypothetical protein
MKLNRRNTVKLLGQAAGVASLGSCAGALPGERNRGKDKSAEFGLTAAADRKFIIVLTCSGGASILDSFMALSESDITAGGGNPANLNCFPDAQITRVGDLRAVNVDHVIAPLGGYPVKTSQAEFLQRHASDIMVVTTEGTSVNHGIAQKRSLTGNDAWQGRTLQEAVAAHYGSDLPLANFNMGVGGFGIAGIDPTLPGHAKPNSVTDPSFWALGLSATAGVNGAPPKSLLAVARELRDTTLEPASNFFKTFRKSAAIERWVKDRRETLASYEQLDLLKKLAFSPDFDSFLPPTPEVQMLRATFPDFGKDSLDAQAISAYLALTTGVACAVTLGPGPGAITEGLDKFYNPPIAFDFSHSDHRGTQALMWERVLRVADRLIELLKQKEFNPATGESYWDRTLIYFASDFGRDKTRTSGATTFSTGHHLNNASVIISPMVNGGKILGGVDPQTALTYGFDPQTGTPEKGRKTSEKELYSGILHALGVDTKGSGLPDMRAMRKA